MQWIWPAQKPVVFVRLAKLLRRRVVYTAHNILPHDDNSEKTFSIMKRFYELVDQVIVHSESNRRELRQLFSVPSAKISVIPHGNYGFFRASTQQCREEARHRLNIDQRRKVVLFFGTIRKYKGLEVLLSAFHQAYEQQKDLFLLVAGQPEQYDGKDKEFFYQKVAHLSQQGAVRLDLEYIPMEEVGFYFEAADLVALPYLKACQSGIVQLAFAYGKPVIVTRTGGLPDVVDDKVTGSVVEPHCEAELAAEILRLFKCEETLPTMGQNALQVSQSVYSWNAIADSTQSLY
jgi:glycosyltransferase involved in cell wall biosynthesis